MIRTLKSVMYLSIVFAILFPQESRTQIFEQGALKGTSILGGGGSYYNFSSGSGCDLKVSIWGFVRNPGRYTIPCEANLLELISFAGGPLEGAFLDKVMIVRRGGPEKQNEIKEVFYIDLQKYLRLSSKSSPALDLLLVPGDLIVVDGEPIRRYDLVTYLQILVTLSTTVTAIAAIINMFKK